jgi:hypothetical protein
MPKSATFVSYWSAGVVSTLPQYVYHPSLADAVYLASCQEMRNLFAPSASVWMVPGVEDHD